jgi:hypothetical protein
MYAHLSQEQAIQVLELNGRLAESMNKSKLLIEKTLGDNISAVNSKMYTTIAKMIKPNQEVIMNMLVESTKKLLNSTNTT